MSTDNAWLEALDADNRMIEQLLEQRDHARSIAIALEAENHAIVQAANTLLGNYLGDICEDTTTCDCALAHLTRLLTR